MQSSATTVAAYLREVAPDRRQDLSKLRMMIRRIAPDAKETIQHGMPYYELNGQLCALAAQKNYLALYVCDADLVDLFRARLGKANVGKGCIRFRALPDLEIDAVEELLHEVTARHRQATPAS